ncbi:MAG: NAD-dependent epimerase/dehydratase family protein [Pseudomonadales bacterium]
MQTVLVVGASGFVGTHLVSYLRDREFEVRVATVRAGTFDKALCSKEMTGVVAVINAAGLAHSAPGVAEEQRYYSVNAEFPQQLAECVIEQGVELFIHISSVKASTYQFDQVNDEAIEQQPIDVYGRSKREAETGLAAMDWMQSRCIVLRPVLVFGPGVRANLRSLLSVLRCRFMPSIEGSGHRSMVSVNDLCSAIISCLRDSCSREGVYIVADPESYTIARIHSAVRLAQSRKASSSIKMSADALLSTARFVDRLFLFLPFHIRFFPKVDKLLGTELYSAKRFIRDFDWTAAEPMELAMPAMLRSLKAEAHKPERKSVP